MKKTMNLVFAGLCVGMGVVLPIAFHQIPNGGSVFLPMHIPVLLCGLLCGPYYGLACGILAPLLSSLMTGMPPMAVLPGMLCELAVYGLVAGLLIRWLKFHSKPARIYVALICAMVCGRVVSGVLNALIFRLGSYSLQMWLASAFVTALPGIVVQLVMIPIILLALDRAGYGEFRWSAVKG